MNPYNIKLHLGKQEVSSGSVPGCSSHLLGRRNPSWSVSSSVESAHYHQWHAVRIPQPLGAVTLPLIDVWEESKVVWPRIVACVWLRQDMLAPFKPMYRLGRTWAAFEVCLTFYREAV